MDRDIVMVEFIPTGVKVIVIPYPEEKEITAYIEIVRFYNPVNHKRGRIIALGPGIHEVNVNDEVIYGKYSYQEIIANDGEVFHILRESDILAKIRG